MKTSWLNGAFCFGGALLLAAVFGVGGCSSLPDEEVYPVDITIGEIEANMQKALDPDGRYAKAKSYVQRQITQEIRWLEENADEMLTDVKFVSPDKLMMVNIVDNAPQSGIIINGDRGWQIDYANKRSNELGESQMKLVRTLTLIANPGSRLSKVFDDLKITGCRVGDEDFYKLVCTGDDSNPNLPSLDIYIDKDDFLIKGYRVGKSSSKIIRYGLHEGVRIPVEIETVANGRKNRVSVVDYKLDVPIPLTDFYPPVFR